MTTERELALELRVKQLEGVTRALLDAVENRELRIVNETVESVQVWRDFVSTRKAPTPDPSPLWDVLRAAVERYKEVDIHFHDDERHLKWSRYRDTEDDAAVLRAVEALPAELRQLLEGGK